MDDHDQQRVLQYLNMSKDQAVQLGSMIQSYDDFHRLRNTYHSLKDNDAQMSGNQDGPQTDEARQQYVEVLVAYVSPSFFITMLSPDVGEKAL